MRLDRKPAGPLTILILLFLAAWLGACSSPAPSKGASATDDWPPLDYYVERLESETRLDHRAGVHIVNHWGDIRVRSGDAGSIRIDAAVQRIGAPFPERPEFRVTENASSYELVVQYTEASLEPRTGRVDLAVYVPDSVRLRLETLDGTIEAKETTVDLTARTVSGEVFFINQGNADVETQFGNITARPTAPGWGALTLYTATGKIAAFLPVGRGLEAIARGTENIHSDWPLVNSKGLHLLALGTQDKGKDTALITSGGSIELLEVVLGPLSGEQQTRQHGLRGSLQSDEYAENGDPGRHDDSNLHGRVYREGGHTLPGIQ